MCYINTGQIVFSYPLFTAIKLLFKVSTQLCRENFQFYELLSEVSCYQTVAANS